MTFKQINDIIYSSCSPHFFAERSHHEHRQAPYFPRPSVWYHSHLRTHADGFALDLRQSDHAEPREHHSTTDTDRKLRPDPHLQGGTNCDHERLHRLGRGQLHLQDVQEETCTATCFFRP